MKSSLTNVIHAKRTLSNIKIIDHKHKDNNAITRNSKLKQFKSLSLKVSGKNMNRYKTFISNTTISGFYTKNNRKNINRSIDVTTLKTIPKIPKRNERQHASFNTTVNHSPINKKEMYTLNHSNIYEEGDEMKILFMIC